MTQYFKHTLPTQTITIREDANSQSDNIETHSGKWYPLIRIKEKVIEFPDIVNFNLSSSIYEFLPILNITVDDNEKIQRESNFVEDNDVITIFVGNAEDGEYEVIKNDYYVLNAPSFDSSGLISLTCVLHVPHLWVSTNRVFDDTSFNVFKAIAKECKLGFISNISNTNDKMKWIQHQSNYDFIKWLQHRAFVKSDTSIIVFVDQFANLVVLDIKQAFTTFDRIQLTTMPISGEKLQTPVDCIATNNVQGEDDIKVQITSWSPINEFGELAIKYANQWGSIDINPNDRISTTTTSTSLRAQLRNSSTITSIINENVHSNYNLAKITNYQNTQWLQSMKINVVVQDYFNALYLCMNMPVEIWNLRKNEERLSQDTTVDNDELQNVEPTGEKIGEYHINSRYTGEYFLSGMSMKYNRQNRRSAQINIQQSLELIKK